jgi:amino acid adenylation domain-containing protein
MASSESIYPLSERPGDGAGTLSNVDCARVLYDFNDTAVAYQEGRLIHEIFEEQAGRTPHAVAVEHDQRKLTYLELNRQANQLARYLVSQGVGPDEVVAICVERRLEMIAGLLGILKAGGAYLPLDPNYPGERISQMLEDAKPRVILTQTDLMGVLPETSARVKTLDEKLVQLAAHLDGNLPRAELGLSSNNLVYVIYTSGSTGRPKATAMRHRSMVNLIQWHDHSLGSSEGQTVLQFAALSFDVAFQEIFSTLCTGGTLVLLDEWMRRDARALTQLLVSRSIRRLFVPPLMLQSLAEYTLGSSLFPRSLKDVITAGEQLRISPEIRQFFERATGCRLHNHYGPTETHVVTALTLEGDPQVWPVLAPIGRPIANSRIYVVDEHLQPVPIGMAGEIYIGGANVARGYLHRPELTEQRFVADPYSSDPQARLYRTGDLGRWREDGILEYLGRNDDQVKIRGYRIELGEIEARIRQVPDVKDAAVIAREDATGERRLVAYLIPKSECPSPVVAAIRERLMDALPEYMVPSAFVFLAQFPLTPSGKLDRRGLPAPDVSPLGGSTYEAPLNSREETLAGVWQDLLRRERVGRQDDFFELGGQSLLLMRMIERLARSGWSVEARQVYDNPVLADLAATLVADVNSGTAVPPNLIPTSCARITPEMLPLVELEQEHIDRIAEEVPGGVANIQDICPLAPLQEGMLFHHLLDQRAADTYVLPTLLYVSSRETLDELIAALQAVIEGHDVLRTAVLWEQLPRPVQVVCRNMKLRVDEVSLQTTLKTRRQIEDWMGSARQRLDLRQAPLLRLQVAQDPEGDGWYALLRFHHIVCDHVTVEILTAELVAILKGRAPPEPDAVPYRNHVARMLTRARERDPAAFFRDMLSEVSEPTAPFGILEVHGDGTQVLEATRALAPELGTWLRTQALQNGVSAATLFHAAWALVVASLSGRDDVVFGTMLMGRFQGSLGERALGLFINTLPLRIRLQGVNANELVEHTRDALVGLLAHEHASLAEARRCSSIAGSAPLFTALFNYRHIVLNPDAEWDSTPGIRSLGWQERTNYPITMSVDDLGVGFSLTAQTDRRIDPRRLLEQLSTALSSLVEALEHAPRTPALALRVLPDTERRAVIEEFNPVRQYRQEQLIQELFEAQVRLHPQAIAVTYEGESISYGELNSRANQLAWHLRERGVGSDQLVGLCVERSLEMVVGLLGILKAGGAYLPLDPSYPAERLAYILGDAAPSVVLTQEHLKGRLPQSAAEVMTIDTDWEVIGRHATRNPALRPQGMSSESLAYVIYTSGSTGNPKGVMIEHRNVVRLFAATESWFGFGSQDVWTLFHSFAFDFSVWELWGALLYGGRVVIVPQLTARSSQEFYRLLCREGVTVLNQTPSAFAQLIQAQGQCQELEHVLRVVIFGGEALEFRTLRPWVQRNGAEQPQLVNMYGITETTVHVTYRQLSKEEVESERGSIIGRPIPDLKTYILDQRGDPAPIGVVGEIYVGGAGVARGYLNRPQLTRERFVPDPFSSEANARMYKTGDLGRWRADGTMEYLGRNDEQVKIRGFRIELGEIEAQLVRHGEVKEAVVLAREDEPGDKRLVGYVIATQGVAAPSAESLREHLRAVLPEYMVPSAFVVLEAFPLTPNGKLDRRGLPAPDLSSYTSREYEAPRGEIEEILAGIWGDLLHLERVGRHDNFFELGGHSLLIVQMMERLRRMGLSTEVRRVFESPTLSDLAGQLFHGVGEKEVPPNLIPPECERITPQMLPLVQLEQEHIDRIAQAVPGGAGNIQDIYPLAPLQEGMLFHHLLDNHGADAYLQAGLFAVSSRPRLMELIVALQSVIDRHDILRTALFWERLPQPMQVVHRSAFLPVEEVTLSGDGNAETQVREWLRSDRRQRLDLRQAPLMRLMAANDPKTGKCFALLEFHHSVCDNKSLDLMLGEVAAHLESRGDQLPPPVQYRTHVAEALAHSQLHDAETFFRAKYQDVDAPTAPFGLLDVHGDGSCIRQATRVMDSSLAERLRVQARKLGVTAATLFHAAWALVVACTSGRDDVVFGTVLLGRLHGSAGAHQTLGMFINTLPVRLNLPELTPRLLVEKTQLELVELFTHEQSPLAIAQRSSGVPPSTPLFSALLNYRHGAMELGGEFHPEGVSLIDWYARTNYPVMLSVDELRDGFALSADTDQSINPERLLDYMCTAALSLVEALDQNARTPVLALDVLPEPERDQVLRKFNGASTEYPKEKLIHELVEEQAEQTPHGVAVEHRGRRLTYAQLNARANQLARYLLSEGVAADQVIGLCMKRGLQMIVGVLGVLKAGGAYLPLDPNYPTERLKQMLEDAAPRFVLTETELVGLLPSCSARIIALDEELGKLTAYVDENVRPSELGVNSENLVYVIYTSGSTGRPKGTAMRHRSVVNLIEWHRRTFGVREGQRALQFAALSFDVAFQEIFSTLCTGGTLVLLDEWVRRDAQALVALLTEQSIHRLFLPPLMLQSVAEYCQSIDQAPSALQDVITAGEQLRISPEIRSFFMQISDCRLHNHYGPTETHVVTALMLVGDPGLWPELPPIGRPLDNTQLYVLNGQMRPAPVGVAGEVYIGGANVARGYLNRPELTEQRFVANPYSSAPGARLYKTGDLGRWRDDGLLEYLGRNDGQVKIRGFRVELQEVEVQLARHTQVKEAVAMVREDAPGEKRQIGYVIPKDSNAAPTIERLREHLQAVLPEYMVPTALVVLEAWPLTPNGKLDRRALPVPRSVSSLTHEYEPPRGELEEILAAIWRDLFHIDRVGRNDNFFELGGHSLSAVQAVVRIRSLFAIEVPVRVIFKHQTLKALAIELAALHRERLARPLIGQGERMRQRTGERDGNVGVRAAQNTP